jgi:enoyl-CoA hydratase/carnithine racemase
MSDLLIDQRGPALWLTINRPEKRNAMSADVVDGLREGYERAQRDDAVRVIVVTGTGDKAFCAGADLQPGRTFQFNWAEPTTAYADLLRLAQNTFKPSIAVLNGTCMAGGMGLLAMVDMAVAADDIKLGLPEVKVGVYPMQVMALLKDLVPPRVLREWAYTGEPFSVQEAQAAGLVNHVVPRAELAAKAEWLIGRLIDKSPAAIRRGKYAMRALDSMDFDAAIAFTEGQIALMGQTDDAREGVAAFAEKRPPAWKARQG